MAPEPWQLILESVARVETRLDRLVTTETHSADVRRLDERYQDLVTDLGQERAVRAEDRAEQGGKIEALRQALETEGENRRKGDEADLRAIRTELAAEKTQRRKDRQWLIMAIVAVVGVVVAVAVPVALRVIR